MCISFFFAAAKGITNNGQQPRYRLIAVTNRDEALNRDTLTASWVDGVLAGWDNTPGKVAGTWMGMDAKGRLGILTNIYTGPDVVQGEKGRGGIVTDFLRGQTTAKDYLGNIANETVEYNPFNVSLLEPDHDGYYSTTAYTRGQTGHVVASSEPQLMPGQYHGQSNSPFDIPYLKTKKGTELFQAAVQQFNVAGKEAELEAAVLDVLGDRRQWGPDEQMLLQGGGVRSEARESIFVDLPHYGTRMQTLVFVDGGGEVTFVERTRDKEGNQEGWTRREFKFKATL